MHLLKNNSKSIKIQLVAVIALVVMIVPTFALASSTTYVFNFTNSISLLDKVVITTIADGEENKILIAYGENILSYIGQEEKEGYNSSGWEDSNGNKITETTIATEDLILTSSSSPIEYTISYELAGGEAENNPSSYTIESETINLEKPQKAGYEFKGWTGTDLEEATKDVTIAKGSTGNREYTATWSVINYAITYDLDGGSATNPDTYTIESETFTLNKPTKGGFIFKGWTGDNGDTPQKEVTIEKGSTGEKNFTAVWALYDGPSEVTTFSPTNSTRYIFFWYSDWKSTEGEGSVWNDWDANLPSLIFENEITRVRMGFSTTEYVSYNDVEIGIGLVSVENKNRMWFSDNYGKHLDGFWTIGYTENGKDHEIRFRTQSKIITEIETIY